VTEANRGLVAGNEVSAMVPEQDLPDNELGEFVKERNFLVTQLVSRHQELVRGQTARAEMCCYRHPTRIIASGFVAGRIIGL
jgi:hypothetical protein